MIKINIICYLKGDELSHEDIRSKTGIIFHSVKEYKKLNENLSIRVFKKVVTIIPEENNIYDEDEYVIIKKFFDFLKNKIKVFKQFGCEKVVLLLSIQYIVAAEKTDNKL
jgi:hypothetical protein